MIIRNRLNHKRSFLGFTGQFFKRFDLFGKNILLTYEGSSKFRTIIGGLFSFFIYLLILSYVILQLRVMFLRNNTTNSKNSLQKELITNSEVHSIGLKNINFGIDIDFNGANLLNDKSYFTYSINQVSQVYEESKSGFETKRMKANIQTANCNTASFYNMKQEIFETLSISDYLCPTSNNYTIAGNYYASKYDYIEIKVYRCNPATSKIVWKANISDVIRQTQLTLMVSNNFVDFDNYTEAIQNYLDDSYFWYLAPGLRKKLTFLSRRTQLTSLMISCNLVNQKLKISIKSVGWENLC